MQHSRSLPSLKHDRRGFTLIELSVVLVVIGLIVGGVLAGQGLINAAQMRAQITQIEKYNAAVNIFRGKYGYLPGDMRPEAATQFGFPVGTNCNGINAAFRNGDGMIGLWASLPLVEGAGETALFWQDLSSPVAGNLIDSQLGGASYPAITCTGGGAVVMSTTAGSTYVGNYLPAGKIGYGTFLYVYANNGFNWYGLSAVTAGNVNGGLSSSPTLPVWQAYTIDQKIDDGVPATGNVLAVYINNNLTTIQNANAQSSDSATSCYNTTAGAYSIGYKNGSGPNCALSFKMQAGD